MMDRFNLVNSMEKGKEEGAELRIQNSEVRSQNTEVRSQKLVSCPEIG